MSEIHSLCDDILKHLAALGMQTPKAMLPGLVEDNIRQMTAGLPLVLPDSVIELYKWSEGLQPRRTWHRVLSWFRNGLIARHGCDVQRTERRLGLPSLS